MDVEESRCVPRIRPMGQLGVRFTWAQLIGRFLSVLFELGTVAFIAWLFNYWRKEPTTRVDVLMPSFFPLILGIVADAYEVVSLLFFYRTRAINPLAVASDIAVIATGIFCFMVLSTAEGGTGEWRAYWVTDMRNAMIFMIVFCIVHSAFIVMAAAGVILVYFQANRAGSQPQFEADDQLIKSQEEIIRFHEWRMQLPQPAAG
ncbi:hypothetical protein C8A05DRAFT_33299 [Staphylotrichum tortipilum]|uniref:Uncharacterized protein n=1 Tax=Staphylotrichum tortipilum TaxID=2831512 RepID=A0AAN6MM65_9PEZI|nr:hypothetical protein C8A05DRAFT_33299 [Staphylotrichum longicolle]